MYISNKILNRYRNHGRTLPWRKTNDPYAIHISEVMLQQTQVERVVPYFEQWMKDFPDYKTLAKAKKTDLLQHRSWLGFNSRALRLQACAQKVIEHYNGILPQDRAKLLALPGIGSYTSAAIMSFAWNEEIAVIDTNIRRVLIFLYKLDETISLQSLEAFAQTIIPKWKSRDWHNALMDYGALHLTARKTKIKSLSKQSQFEGSDRQVRWWILKQLITKTKKLNIEDIRNNFPYKEVEKIIQGMIDEKLVIKKWKYILLE